MGKAKDGAAAVLWRELERHAGATPDAVFLLSDRGSTTYSVAWKQVSAAARGLVALGVKSGDRVAMLTPPDTAFPIAFLACGMVGAIWTGINTRYTQDEIRFVLEDSRPRLLLSRDRIGERDYRATIESIARTIPSIETLLFVPDARPKGTTGLEQLMAFGEGLPTDALEAPSRYVEAASAALIVYTSGSTGRPKGAVLSHGAILANVAVQARRFKLAASDRFLLHLSPNHVAGSIEMLSGGLHVGCTLVLLESFDVPALLAALARHKVTALLQVPTLFLMMLEHPAIGTSDLSSLKKLYWAGSAAPREMVETLRRRFSDALLVTGYGMSEACGFVTYTAPSDPDSDLMDTVGAVDPDFQLKIVDDTGNLVPDGTVGQIALRGATIMNGYWENLEETNAVLGSDGWYMTGDLGRQDRRGYVTIIGRKKEMYISGGYNIYPREIEAVLEQHEDVSMACVLAKPDRVYQEIGHAFVVPKAGRVLDPGDLIAYCRVRLANYKVPKSISVRDRLPMLGIGKIDRVALRADPDLNESGQ